MPPKQDDNGGVEGPSNSVDEAVAAASVKSDSPVTDDFLSALKYASNNRITEALVLLTPSGQERRRNS